MTTEPGLFASMGLIDGDDDEMVDEIFDLGIQH